MKVLYIVKSLAQPAGTERILTDKMNYLSEKAGIDILVATYEQGTHEIIFPLSPKIKHTDFNTPFYTLRNQNILKLAISFLLMRIRFFTQLRKNVHSFKPDFIVCTTYSDFLIDIIFRFRRKAKIIIEAHVERSAIEYKNKWSYNKLGRIAAKYIDKYILSLIKKASALVLLTNKDVPSWKEIKRVVVIPNFLTYYPNKIESRISNKQIIAVGRLNEQKGFDLLLKAWVIVNKNHPEWTLNIYGNGSDKSSLMDFNEKNSLTQSAFIHDATNKIYDKYMESDFYVLSSRYEGFGLVLIEAMSCGIPCVSFDCPNGPSDIIKEGEDGFLVENGNIEMLAERICFLIENENLRTSMGLKARENVKRYLPDRIIPKWVTLFEQLEKEK